MPNLISEVDIVIASSGLIERHPELFHYTTSAAFDAIMASQELWATHFKDLNDTTEVYLLREPMKVGLTRRFAGIIEEKQKRDFALSVKVNDNGGRQKVAEGLAESFSNTLYAVTYGWFELHSRWGGRLLLGPHQQAERLAVSGDPVDQTCGI